MPTLTFSVVPVQLERLGRHPHHRGVDTDGPADFCAGRPHDTSMYGQCSPPLSIPAFDTPNVITPPTRFTVRQDETTGFAVTRLDWMAKDTSSPTADENPSGMTGSLRQSMSTYNAAELVHAQFLGGAPALASP